MAAARDVPTARKLLQAAVDSRIRQVDQVRKALYEHAGAVAERRKAEARLEACREQEARAEARLAEAQTRREEALARLREAIERWCSECRELPLAARLDELVDAAEDETAVMRVVNDAAAAVAAELTRAETTLDARRQALAEERARLHTERAELARRTVLAPEPPRTRTADRARLPGGPLWRLVDWRPGVDESTQAGVEAALEASGLLDAWVLPSGELAVDGHDTFADGALTTPAPGGSLADVLTVDPDAPVPRVAALLRGIAFGVTAPDHPAAIGADGTWRLGAARGSWAKPAAGFIGAAAQERARARRIAELTARIEDLDERIAGVRAELDAIAGRREALDAEQRRRPGHDELRAATGQVARIEAEVAARADAVSRAQQEHAAAERRVAMALRQLSLVASEHGLPAEEAALDAVDAALGAYRNKGHAWLDLRQQAGALAGQAQAAAERAARSRRDADVAAQEAADLRRRADGLRAKLAEVERSVDTPYRQLVEQVNALRERRGRIAATLRDLRRTESGLRQRIGELAMAMRVDEQASAQAVAARDAAAERFRRLHETGFTTEARLRADCSGMTGVKATLETARAVAEELASVPYEVTDIKRAEGNLSEAMHATQQMLGGRADLALEPDGDVIVLRATVDGVRMGAAALHTLLGGELDQTRRHLTEDERKLFDRTLTGETRRQVAGRIRLAEELKESMNARLEQVRTVSNLRVKLDWRIKPELPPSLKEARDLLLRDPASLSAADREALYAFFRSRIDEVRTKDEASGWEQRLLEVLDYRRWHQFVVLMDKGDGAGWVQVTKRKHGALSGGEKAIALHLPLFAAAAAHYRVAPRAPRLILLDEVFVGVDDGNRGQLLDLLVSFDLDMVLTSDHEWCTYAELDGIAIHQLIASDEDDAVTMVRFVWDGHRVRDADPEPPPRRAERDTAETPDQGGAVR